jgi:hypothetical protein
MSQCKSVNPALVSAFVLFIVGGAILTDQVVEQKVDVAPPILYTSGALLLLVSYLFSCVESVKKNHEGLVHVGNIIGATTLASGTAVARASDTVLAGDFFLGGGLSLVCATLFPGLLFLYDQKHGVIDDASAMLRQDKRCRRGLMKFTARFTDLLTPLFFIAGCILEIDGAVKKDNGLTAEDIPSFLYAIGGVLFLVNSAYLNVRECSKETGDGLLDDDALLGVDDYPKLN